MEEMDPKFSGIERLYGKGSLRVLSKAHVCVLGIGGVGSWACEALARSGVGELTIVDPDDICQTNINRQVHATLNNVGVEKIKVMKERILSINSGCKVNTIQDFFYQKNMKEILSVSYSYVLDAIDNAKNKCLAINYCKKNNIPIITVGGAGGKRNPGLVEVRDLGRTCHDNLCERMRKVLRREYGFPLERKPMKVPCVFSSERPIYSNPDGEICSIKSEASGNLRLDCHSGLGTASFITGQFGLMAAYHIIDSLLSSSKE